MKICWFFVIACFILLSGCLYAQAPSEGFDYEAAGIKDYANNDTRALCIELFMPALVATGHVTSSTKFNPSNLMINAHTARAEGLTCFITYDNELYFVFHDWGGQKTSSMVVKYSLRSFDLFDFSEAITEKE